MPEEGDFWSRVSEIENLPMKDHDWCYTHGCYCPAASPETAADVDFSGLPCEENSRCNINRQFLNGRFANVYAVWAKRHKKLKTPLAILENTLDPLQHLETC